MAETTPVRVDRTTHDELKRLARERNSTVAETVSRAVRALRQERMGEQLADPLGDSDHDWLDANIR